jgi:hypothetical protein
MMIIGKNMTGVKKMKCRIVMLIPIALLLLVTLAPTAALANNSYQTTIKIGNPSVLPGDKVVVTGTARPGSWVPMKVFDEERNIVVFDATKSDQNGDYSINFTVPDTLTGTLIVVVGEGYDVKTGTVKVQTGTGDEPGNNTGDGTGNSNDSGTGNNEDNYTGDAPKNSSGISTGSSKSSSNPVTSSSGSAIVKPGGGGTVSLGDEAAIELPGQALYGTDGVEVKVTRVSTPPETSEGFRILGNVYEFSVAGKSSYRFAEKVTIRLSFNPNELKANEFPVICYYNEDERKWVKLGGEVFENTVTVQVDHFTRFAVMAERKDADLQLHDIAGHWAEQSIKELVASGAISGYPDATFKPDSNITRAEFATILVKAYGMEPRNGKVFNDTVGHWAQSTLATAEYHGIINGLSPDMFGPDQAITREQMAVMIVKAADLPVINGEMPFSDSNRVSSWARSFAETARQNGIINGFPDNTFRPQDNATRAQAVTVILNALQIP